MTCTGFFTQVQRYIHARDAALLHTPPSLSFRRPIPPSAFYRLALRTPPPASCQKTSHHSTQCTIPLQALDEPSWSVLKAISEEPASGVLCVIASRPLARDERGFRDYQAVLTSPSTSQIYLREMSVGETRELICKRICPAEKPVGIPESVFQAIYSKTHVSGSSLCFGDLREGFRAFKSECS